MGMRRIKGKRDSPQTIFVKKGENFTVFQSVMKKSYKKEG